MNDFNSSYIQIYLVSLLVGKNISTLIKNDWVDYRAGYGNINACAQPDCCTWRALAITKYDFSRSRLYAHNTHTPKSESSCCFLWHRIMILTKIYMKLTMDSMLACLKNVMSRRI